jgi:putative peptidoglycan lipid II flippase
LVTSAGIAFLFFLVRAVGALKELIIAKYFGRSQDLDSYLGAIILPTILTNVLVATGVQAAIPATIQVRASFGEDKAKDFFIRISTYLLLLLSSLSVLLVISGKLVLGILLPGFDSNAINSAAWIFRCLIPTIPISGISALIGGHLQTHGRLSVPTITPSITPCTILISLALLPIQSRILALVMGFNCGAILELVVLSIYCWRVTPFSLKRVRSTIPNLPKFFSQYGALVGSAALVSMCAIVDQAMTSKLGTGSISALAYGSKIPAVAISIIAFGIGTTFLPEASNLVALSNWKELRRLLTWTCRPAVAIGILCAAVIIFSSKSIVRTVFERGEFRPTDTELVSSVQAAYALQAPFYLLGIVYAKLFTALSSGRTLMILAMVNLAINTVGNLVLSRYFGVAGIALSSSLVQLVSCVLMSVLLWHGLRSRVTTPMIAAQTE